MFSAEEMGEDELTINPDGRGFVNVNSNNMKLSQYYPHMTPLQYTGAKDMHKTDIYEGDIVRKEECAPDDPAFGHYGSIGTIRYDIGTMGFIIDSEDDGFYDNMGANFSFDEIEVIGNVYENPETIEAITK